MHIFSLTFDVYLVLVVVMLPDAFRRIGARRNSTEIQQSDPPRSLDQRLIGIP